MQHRQLILRVKKLEYVQFHSIVFNLGASAGSSYASVDPYSGYPTTAYAYPPSGAAAAAPPTASGQPAYAQSYGSSPTTAGYAYDSRRATPPPTTPTGAHYAPYDYASGTI